MAVIFQGGGGDRKNLGSGLKIRVNERGVQRDLNLLDTILDFINYILTVNKQMNIHNNNV